MAQEPVWQVALDRRLPIWQVPAVNALQQYLVDAEITAADFARSIGLSPSTVWRQVRGKRNPSLGVALAVERGTRGKVSADEFMAICIAARREAMKPARKAKATRAAA